MQIFHDVNELKKWEAGIGFPLFFESLPVLLNEIKDFPAVFQIAHGETGMRISCINKETVTHGVNRLDIFVGKIAVLGAGVAQHAAVGEDHARLLRAHKNLGCADHHPDGKKPCSKWLSEPGQLSVYFVVLEPGQMFIGKNQPPVVQTAAVVYPVFVQCRKHVDINF